MLNYLATEAEHNPIVPIWQEVVVGTVAFALLCFILMKYVFPQMEKMFAERVDAIEGGIKRAEEAQAEAKATLEQYKAQLAEARTEAAAIRDEARAEAARISADLHEEARAEAARIVARGTDQLQAERESLVAELRGDIGRLAVDLASRIVGEALADEARRASTVERFLAELDAEDTTTAGRR